MWEQRMHILSCVPEGAAPYDALLEIDEEDERVTVSCDGYNGCYGPSFTFAEMDQIVARWQAFRMTGDCDAGAD